MNLSTRRIAAVLSFACTLSLATAGDWPQWRGPKRDGISTETGLLKAWPAGGPPLAWKARGMGVGFSSVSIASGKIFTMGDGPDQSSVRAFDANGGKLLWSTPVGKPGGNYAGTRCTPTVDGTLVYALGQFGDLVCAEANTGREVWRKNLMKDFGGQYAGWNYTESPLVDGDRLLVTPGGARGAMVALNKQTGATIWQSKEFTDGAAYASIIPVEMGGRRQYVQLTEASVAGVAAESGQLLWRAPRRGATAVIPTPIFFDNQVYVTSGYGVGCNLFKISQVGAAFSAQEVYANKEMVNHHGGVVLLGKHLYGHSDRRGWICQEFSTGKTVWSNQSVGKGALTYADGHLYLRSEEGPVALVAATPQGYQEKGRFNQPDRSNQNSWAHPVIAHGKLYLRDQDVLLCYDVREK